jgi:hypothetical protein
MDLSCPWLLDGLDPDLLRSSANDDPATGEQGLEGLGDGSIPARSSSVSDDCLSSLKRSLD